MHPFCKTFMCIEVCKTVSSKSFRLTDSDGWIGRAKQTVIRHHMVHHTESYEITHSVLRPFSSANNFTSSFVPIISMIASGDTHKSRTLFTFNLSFSPLHSKYFSKFLALVFGLSHKIRFYLRLCLWEKVLLIFSVFILIGLAWFFSWFHHSIITFISCYARVSKVKVNEGKGKSKKLKVDIDKKSEWVCCSMLAQLTQIK